MNEKEIPSSKNVGIWLRVSTEDQAQGDSPKHHEIRARSYAEAKGWKILKIYHLEAVSGKSVMEHPECLRMLQDIRSGTINALIFSKLARLARNSRELLEFADIFRDHDADLISLQESIDTSSAVGRLFYSLTAAVAQWEREEISDRVAASVPIRAKLGKSLGGKAPFGYIWVDGNMIPHPEEAPVCKKIFEIFLKCKRLKTTARELNESGYRTSRGSRFSDSTVRRTLTNPVSKGIRRANYTKSSGNGKHWDIKPESEWIHVEVEPIVSEEIWNQCNDILEEMAKKHKKPARIAHHLFTGFLYCECGERMYVTNNGPKYICFKCHNKIPRVDIEGVYCEQLKNYFYSPEEIEKYLKTSDSYIKEQEELLYTLHIEFEKVTKSIDKIYQLYIDDKISKEMFAKRNKPLEERLYQLEEELPKIQGEIDALKINLISSDQTITEALDLHSQWSKLDIAGKRQIIEHITDKIIVGSDSITINLCYLPTSHPLKKPLNGNEPSGIGSADQHKPAWERK